MIESQESNWLVGLVDIDEAIKGRRSVRKYLDEPVKMEIVREVLEAATWAPSAKNGQQWRFTVLTGSSKKELATLFRRELNRLSGRVGMDHMGSSFNSCRIMEEAPVVIIVWNSNDAKFLEESSLQGVSAAIQNMLLKATSLGLGSLWICDIYYATEAITKHFNKTWKLVAAVALGVSGEKPKPKPRKSVDEVSERLD